MDRPTGNPGLDLGALAARLISIDGVEAVTLGGSRARGTHRPESDVDLGLYYRRSPDLLALGALARDVAGPDALVTALGEWGPWVDGGGWLVIDGVHVDWIYRDLARVRDCWRRTRAGSFDWHRQVGHPLGVPDFCYVGEVALAVILADRSGELTELQRQVSYPQALADALVSNLWEAQFLVAIAAKATSRVDVAYVAACLSRAVLLCAYAISGRDHDWLVNEKGAVEIAAQLPSAPPDFANRVREVLGGLGTTEPSLRQAISRAGDLVADVRSACDRQLE